MRVTWSGERLPVEGGWGGGDWDELVGMAALTAVQAGFATRTWVWVPRSTSSTRRSTGWPHNTPDDHETRYLEATVTTFENTRGPTVTVLRSVEREPPL